MNKVLIIASLLLIVAESARFNGGEPFAYHVQEKLSFHNFWGLFVVGRAAGAVQAIEPVDVHDCYGLVGRGKTSGLVHGSSMKTQSAGLVPNKIEALHSILEKRIKSGKSVGEPARIKQTLAPRFESVRMT